MPYFQGDALQEYNRLYRKYDSIFHELALSASLSNSAFAILYYIMEGTEETCSQKELCNRLFLSKQTIHSSIRKLREEGLLTLEPGKGRDLKIRLTPAGRRLGEERLLPLMELENDAFRDMGPKDSRLLFTLTDRYLAIYQKKANSYIRKKKSPFLPEEGREREKGI